MWDQSPGFRRTRNPEKISSDALQLWWLADLHALNPQRTLCGIVLSFASVYASQRAGLVLEASTESEWVARHLESLGHEVIALAPSGAVR